MAFNMDFTLSGAAKAPALRPALSLDRFSTRRPLYSQAVPPQTLHGAPPYLVHLASLDAPNPVLLTVSHPSLVTLVDKATASTLHSARLSDVDRITQVHALPPSAGGSSFVASSTNGTVSTYDIRSAAALAAPTLVLKGSRGGPFHSVAASPHPSNPHLVAAGTELLGVDAYVELYDVRSPGASLFRYTESHSDDVTTLVFHPSPEHADILLTGSTDGLLCAVDTTVQDENDAVIAVGNTNSSVARAGWGGGGRRLWGGSSDVDMTNDGDDDLMQQETDARRRCLDSVWAVGDMQTLSVWDADKFDPLLYPVDVRSSTCLQPAWTTDYIIDAHCSSRLWSPAVAASPIVSPFTVPSLGVSMYVGTSTGSFSIITASPEAAGGYKMEALFPEASDRGSGPGHNDIVRCVDYDAATRVLYSGGEDGRLCTWRVGADDGDDASTVVSRLEQSQLVAPPSSTATSFGRAIRAGGRGTSESGSARSSPRNDGPLAGRNQRWKPYG